MFEKVRELKFRRQILNRFKIHAQVTSTIFLSNSHQSQSDCWWLCKFWNIHRRFFSNRPKLAQLIPKTFHHPTEMQISEPSLQLNSLFSDLPLSQFPKPTGGITVVSSTASIAQAASILSSHRILSAPVLNNDAGPDARWSEKYVGLVDMVKIVQFVVDEANQKASVVDFRTVLKEAQKMVTTSVTNITRESFLFLRTINEVKWRLFHFCHFKFSNHSIFFISDLCLSEASRFGPLMPMTTTHTLLDAMLVLGKYGVHRLPVVDMDSGQLVNFLTQSQVVAQVLDQCKDREFVLMNSSGARFLGFSTNCSSSYILGIQTSDDGLKATVAALRLGTPNVRTVSEGDALIDAFKIMADEVTMQ
jgi:CBS domain-containing protein